MWKVKVLTVLFLGIGCGGWSQIVTIPDTQFKNALLFKDVVDTNADGIPDSTADFNSDGEIQTSEALQIERLYVRAEAIESLEGIEAFTNLIILSCNQNSLTTLDFSQNLLLRELNCFFNNLTEINISQNTALEVINCEFNELATLDLSGNPNLERLWCTFNQFTAMDVTQNPVLKNLNISSNEIAHIDVSQNPQLDKLYFNNNNFMDIDLSENLLLSYLDCSNNLIQNLDLSAFENLNYLVCRGNQLESLNFQTGTNLNVQYFNAEENPALSCIQVDDAAYSATQSSWIKDETSNYSENCLLSTLSLDEFSVGVFPNPVRDKLYYNASVEVKSVSIFDAMGRKIKVSVGSNFIDLSSMSAGIYSACFESMNGFHFKKIIKE